MTTPRSKRAGEVLLRAFSQDAANAGAKERTIAAIGASAAFASVAAESTAAAKVAGAGGTGLLKLAVAKAGLIGALCGAATLGGAHYIGKTSSRAPDAALADRLTPPGRAEPDEIGRAGVEPRAPLEGPARDLPNALDPHESSELERERSAPSSAPAARIAAPPAARKASPSNADPTPSPSVLRDQPTTGTAPLEPLAAPPLASAPTRDVAPLFAEIKLVDAARASLIGANPSDALRTLDQYRAEFPNGKLSEEAAVLRIEALAKLGDNAGAERLAREFVRAHPASGHLSKISSILSKGASR